jgi:hypothetical protein
MNFETTLGSLRKVSGWSMVWGVVMLICGILAHRSAFCYLGRNCNPARMVDSLCGGLPSDLRLPIYRATKPTH